MWEDKHYPIKERIYLQNSEVNVYDLLQPSDCPLEEPIVLHVPPEKTSPKHDTTFIMTNISNEIALSIAQSWSIVKKNKFFLFNKNYWNEILLSQDFLYG